MWLSEKVIDMFKVSREVVSDLRTENAVLKVERDSIQRDLLTTKANFAWLTTRVTALEAERAALLMKVAGIAIPFPEVTRNENRSAQSINDASVFSFDHIDDETARKLGISGLLS